MNTNENHIEAIDLISKKLAGEARMTDLELLQSLVATDKEIAQLEVNMTEAWNLSQKAAQVSKIDVDHEWMRFRSKVMPTKQVKFDMFSWSYAVAASFVVLLGILAVYIINQNLSTTFTAALQAEEFTLPDGSTVALKQGSSVSFKNKMTKRSEREVKLNGIAYFDVVSNPEKPFVIHTQDADVKVLGTSFYVNAEPDKENIEVIVVEGKVKLYNRSNESNGVLLAAGDKGIYRKSDQSLNASKEVSMNTQAWHTGKLVYQNERLDKVAADLSRMYARKISVSPAIAGCRITATFENMSLETVLRIIKETFQLQISETEQQISLDGKPC